MAFERLFLDGISSPRLRFVTATGHLLDSKQSLADIGLKDGDYLGAVVPEALAEGFILVVRLLGFVFWGECLI